MGAPSSWFLIAALNNKFKLAPLKTISVLCLKTKRKRTEICFIVFISLYLVGIENGIGNPGNKYENGNHWI
jgi:hypothetical protein